MRSVRNRWIPMACRTAALLAAVAASVSAQALKNERHVLSRRLELRAELVRACRFADAEARARAVAACDGLSRADPLVPIVRAIAAVRDETWDDAAAFRAGLFSIVVPEVVDVDRFQDVFVTLLAARKVEPPGPLGVEAVLRDALGRELGRDVVEAPVDPTLAADDLVRARIRAQLKIDPEAVGPASTPRFEVEVVPTLGAQPPSPFEPSHRARVTVRSDFAVRALRHPLPFTPFHPEYTARNQVVEEMLVGLESVLEESTVRAAWRAALARVDRAFRGEPRLPGVDAVRDLEALEGLLAAVSRGEDPRAAWRDGVRRTVGLPWGATGTARLVDTPYAMVSLRVPPPDARESGRALLVCMPGQPTWDGATDRPTSRFVEDPDWLVAEFAAVGLDLDDPELHIAIVESPGRVRAPIPALVDVTRALTELLDVDPARVTWAGERDGAYCVSRALVSEDNLASRAVLINGGSFSNDELDALGDEGIEILAVGSDGHPGAPVLRDLVDRADGRCAVHWLAGESLRPWPIALPLSAHAIRAFAVEPRAPSGR